MPEGASTPDLVELAQRAFDATNEGDLDTLVSLYSPDVVWDSGSPDLVGERFEGRVALRGFFEEWFRTLEDMEVEPAEIRDVGNGVTLSQFLQRGRPHGSTLTLESRLAMVSIWADGFIRENRVFTDIDEARAAAEQLAEDRGSDAQTNLERVRGFAERWNAGERSVQPEELDPEVVVESMVSSVAGEPYRGHAGMEQWFRDLDDQFGEWQIRYDEVREVGSAVIATGCVSLRGRVSDVVFDQPMSWVIDFGPDGRVTSVRIFLDSDAALKAVEE